MNCNSNQIAILRSLKMFMSEIWSIKSVSNGDLRMKSIYLIEIGPWNRYMIEIGWWNRYRKGKEYTIDIHTHPSKFKTLKINQGEENNQQLKQKVNTKTQNTLCMYTNLFAHREKTLIFILSMTSLADTTSCPRIPDFIYITWWTPESIWRR